MTSPSRLTGALAAVLAVILVAACGTATPSAVPAPTPNSTPAPAGSPPAAVCDDAVAGPVATQAPGDPDAATYAEIEAQVQELRGITATAPVARGVLDGAGLCTYLRGILNRENPEELVLASEKLLKHLLLIPESTSLNQLYLDLYASQAIGLYDNIDKQMYVVSRGGGIGPAEEVTYAHEFTHALQDQAFDMTALRGTAPDQGDRKLARTALAEGDATLLMTLWEQQHLTPDELVEMAGTADAATLAALESLPAIIKDPLTSMYLTGLTPVLAAYGKGGFKAVDDLYRNPPDSMEQILHADKLASDEAPVVVAIPDDLATRMGDGWKVSTQDTLGEFQLEIVAREGGASEPGDAAAGWGGDRIALLEGPGGETAVVLDTAWDTTKDADEFAAAIDATAAKLNAAGRSAKVLRPSENRVVLLSAGTADTLGRVANVLGLAE